jgi:CheY-like chemotaxis protein/anti-sigma regulatory factor (Ser/Thr protein kinase)
VALNVEAMITGNSLCRVPVTWQVSESVPQMVILDDNRFKQILTNLVGNALKFTKEGEVTVEVSLHDDGHTPKSISVRDTGIGIPPDRLKAIFEAFQQADGTTSREFGGTGLGLTISRSLCQLLGFDLRVRSEVGKGSEFTVLLTEGSTAEQRAERQLMEEALRPIESSRPASPDAEIGTKRDGRGRILIIDDDPDSRGLLKRHLEDLGFEVLTAASAEVGIRTALDKRPDLITLDLIMPEMTGWEALKTLKETRDLQDIPVVIVSVVAGEQDRGSLFGAVDLLTKPVDPEELVRVLRRNLGDARGYQVLVVEDDPTTQELFRKHLTEAGLHVTVTGNGQEAEAKMENLTPDLIFLDLMMPVMDGTAFLQRLRKDPSKMDVPVVVCTGKKLLFDERRRLLAQATEIVQKGDDFEESLGTILANHFPMNRPSAKPKGATPGVQGARDGA